jgi:general nucleoside transport system permease protein
MNELGQIFDATLLNSTFRFITPILLAALGGLICQRAGVFNIALEGLMLTGAFFAVVGSYFLQSALGGVLAAMLAGALLALLFAVLTVSLRGNMIVTGIALNLLASGATVFLLNEIFGVRGAFQDPRIQGLDDLSLPGIASVPVLGPIVSGHSWIVYLAWALVPLTGALLFRHRLGLRLRGVGEQPEAAATLGVSVAAVRYGAILASGVLCGLAGAQLSLGQVTLFVENMSAGRGWIAVVAVMFGQAHPLGVFLASVLFGFADSIGFRLQGLGLPARFTGMLPYLVTLIALFVVQARRRDATPADALW